MRSTCLTLIACLSLVLGCAEEEQPPESCPDQQPTLDFTNATGNTVQVIHFVACDQSDQSDYPLPPPGLPTGESVSIPFPGPGCWYLNYEGDGCQGDQAIETEGLFCDDTYEWTADEAHHICVG
ncbi:hypothetical protein ACNOYE_27970 [Nannocystaceae bacterium ST9]